jgi:hypothetical protein
LSALQAFEIVSVIAIAIALAAGIGLTMVYRRLQRYQRDQHVILGSRGTVDIVDHVSAMDDKLANVRIAVEDLTMAVRDHDVRIDSSLSRVGIVRFDAYQDLGGRQSTSVAFLNSLDDGVVVTTVVSRDFARMYVKLLKEGEPDLPLAPEEQEAIDQARGSRPFTIRPRVDADDLGGSLTGAVVAEAPDKPVSLGIPGFRPQTERELARENRRRRREGKPPLGETPVPSANGWDDPHTPVSGGDTSLAELFLKERRVTRQEGDLPAGSSTDDPRESGESDGL